MGSLLPYDLEFRQARPHAEGLPDLLARPAFWVAPTLQAPEVAGKEAVCGTQRTPPKARPQHCERREGAGGLLGHGCLQRGLRWKGPLTLHFTDTRPAHTPKPLWCLVELWYLGWEPGCGGSQGPGHMEGGAGSEQQRKDQVPL